MGSRLSCLLTVSVTTISNTFAGSSLNTGFFTMGAISGSAVSLYCDYDSLRLYNLALDGEEVNNVYLLDP